MRRTSLRTNYRGYFAHLSPDPNRGSIHIEETYLLAALSAETIDAAGSQKACLAGIFQVLLHTQCRRVFEVLNFLDSLRNDVIASGCRNVLFC